MTATRPRPSRLEISEDEWERLRPRIMAALVQRKLSQPTGRKTSAEILLDCAESFLAFLPFWKFKNRDTGQILTFAKLWRGQQHLVHAMMGDAAYFEALPEDEQTDPPLGPLLRARAETYPHGPWLFMLKGGKLGFTELECAYDAWVALFRGANARVHIFSRDLTAAKEVLRIVRYGLLHLPSWFGVRIPKDEADSDTTTSLRLVMGLDDERTIKSYATGENISIDQVAQHVHLDEFAHMKQKKGIWEDVQTTVAPAGTLHIVTRGAGTDTFIEDTWNGAKAGTHELVPFFAPWYWRNDRDQDWYEREANKNTTVGHAHFAPSTDTDALMGDQDNDYIAVGTWARCTDPGLNHVPLLWMDAEGRLHATQEPLVLSLDAAITGDSFAAVIAGRHPDHPEPCHRSHLDPAIRGVKVWRPEEFGGTIPFKVAEGWVRAVCQGGCPGDPGNHIEAHPRYAPGTTIPMEWTKREDCVACQADIYMPPLNIIRACYDRYQLDDMVQRLNNEGIWQSSKRFDQGADRVIADSGMYRLAIEGRLAHDGDPILAEHVKNARAKLQPNEDSKMRIVKKDDKKRVDAAVAASMAVEEALRLHL